MTQNRKGPVIVVVGTRPEGIKMIPVYKALQKAGIPTVLCSTMQHGQLLTDVFDLFQVKPDIDLGIMRMDQNLFYLTQSILQKTKEIFIAHDPRLVLVQGDTTSTMAAALAAFYLHIPIGHVEAGLRTDDLYSPFPEEMNRRVVTTLATYHYAPTAVAVSNLAQTGIDQSRVLCTGNTVVDTLRIVQGMIVAGELSVRADIKKLVVDSSATHKKILVLTMHRRESFGQAMQTALSTIKQFLMLHPDVVCCYPIHPNPHVVAAVNEIGLSALTNVMLCEPVQYHDMVYLLSHAHVVATDSGGIQEEAVSLGKQVIVLREKTERMEGVYAGLATVTGCNPDVLYGALDQAIRCDVSLSSTVQVYGDGYAAEKIVAHIATVVPQGTQQTDTAQSLMTAALAISSVSIHKEEGMEEVGKKVTKKVCVVGLGYIGLPTSIVAAEHGYQVIGYDIDTDKVANIQRGDPVIQEPDIFEKLNYVLSSGLFQATTTLPQADYFIIAVPTPFYANKLADLSYVMRATEAIATVIKRGDVVIVESTIPVGTTQKVADTLHALTGLKIGEDIFVAHCPERVLPGKIFYELVYNDRILGGVDRSSVEHASAFYKQFVKGHLYLTDATTAEMVKLVENSSRDVQIAFANQVASMAYAVGLNPYEVIELANKHPRVNILTPSCGVGGHCIAVDPWFLVETFPEQTQLLKAAREVNDAKPFQVLDFIRSSVNAWQQRNPGRCRVALLGLTYKADVDDMRESPAMTIATALNQWHDVDAHVVEPHVSTAILSPIFGNKLLAADQAVAQADIVVFLVAHKRFKAIDKKLFQGKQLLDFCGLLHTPQQQSTHQETLFWPANSVLNDVGIQQSLT